MDLGRGGLAALRDSLEFVATWDAVLKIGSWWMRHVGGPSNVYRAVSSDDEYFLAIRDLHSPFGQRRLPHSSRMHGAARRDAALPPDADGARLEKYPCGVGTISVQCLDQPRPLSLASTKGPSQGASRTTRNGTSGFWKRVIARGVLPPSRGSVSTSRMPGPRAGREVEVEATHLKVRGGRAARGVLLALGSPWP